MNIPNNIGVFKRYKAKRSTMKYGYYYSSDFLLPFHNIKRTIRVWLPEDYDFDNKDKRFPVIYFSDGQNLVDRYLSAYGDWELDKTIHSIYKQYEKSCILVGIDCPKEPKRRSNELNPPYPVRNCYAKTETGPNNPYANKYVDYITKTLKPLIDLFFYTLSNKENTGIGGSSMGGIMAFYAYMSASETFGFSLSFSPAFFLYSKKAWLDILDKFELSPDKNGKVFLYVGGKDFEEIFIKPTFNTYYYLRKKGFNHDQVRLMFESNELHHEKAWAKYAYDALKFFLVERE